MNNGSKLASWGKWSSRALMGIGFGLGMYDDRANKDKTVGQAVSHGVESAKSWATDIGNAISGGLSALNPFD